MSTKPTDDDGEAHQPTPTAQRSEGGGPDGPKIPDPHVNRREMLKITGAAAGAAAIGTGTASADSVDSDVDYPAYTFTNKSVAAWAHGVIGWGDEELDDPTADETNLHLQAQSEAEWYAEAATISDNFTVDMRPVAHIDARDGIANAYQDGEGSSDGYDRVLDRIAGYYATREQNEINAGLRVLTNFAHICSAAMANDGVDDALLTLHCEREDSDDHALGVVSNDFTETSFELLDGSDFETRVPHIEFYEPAEDGLGDKIGETMLTPSAIMDAEGDEWHEVEIDFGLDPETITTSGSWNLQNLPDYEDDDGDLEFPGIGSVFHMGEWVERIQRIDDERASVQANYDEDLVDTLYEAFDEGDADPSDIRGSVGMARHMGGTEDAQADSYRIALLMQLGLDQADLDGVASMTVNIDGATGRNVETDGSTRNVFATDIVTDREAEGLLYARETPEQGYVTGETYNVPLVYHYAGDDVFRAYSVPGMDLQFELDLSGDQRRFDVHETENEVAIGNDSVQFFDLDDGTELWDSNEINNPYQPSIGPERVFVGRSDGVTALNKDDGSVAWSEDLDGNTDGVQYDPVNEVLYANSTETMFKLDPTNGSEIDSVAGPQSNLVDVTSDGEYIVNVYSTGPDLVVYDNDLNELWSATPTDLEEDLTFVEEEGLVVVPCGDTVEAFDLETGNTEWTIQTDNVRKLSMLTTDQLLTVEYDSGDAIRYDTTDQSQIDSHNIPEGFGGRLLASPDTGGDGLLEGALFFDASEGEELQLTSGTVEIVEQTDRDGEEVEQSDVHTPEHDTNNVEEWTETVEKHTTVYEETIVNEYDQGDGGGGDWWPSAPSAPSVDDFGSQLAGLVVLAVIVVSVIWSVVSDAVPFLGN